MANDYIYKYEDAQGIKIPRLMFIEKTMIRGLNIYKTPEGGSVTLHDSHIRLNAEGESLRRHANVDLWKNIQEFHEKFGLKYDGPPRELEFALDQFRKHFIDEEHGEIKRAQACGDKASELDGLVDLVYVVLGYAYLRGWDFPTAWARVHAKNMQKQRAQHAGESKRGSAHDVVKPPGWTPADLSDLV